MGPDNILYLKNGAPAGVPPAGETGIYADGSGNLKSLNSSGTSTALGGSGVSTVVAGTGVTVDATDPANPIVAAAFGDAWFAARKAEMLVLVPQLTTFVPIRCGNSPFGGQLATQTVSGNIEGGSVGVASDTLWSRFTTNIYQTPKTGKWAVAFQVKYPAITSAKVGHLGLVNSASTHAVTFSADQAVDATHWTIEVIGAATTTAIGTVVADTSVHNVILSFDSTTIKALVDNALSASTATLTNLSDEGMALGCFANASLTPGVVVQRILYGYV